LTFEDKCARLRFSKRGARHVHAGLGATTDQSGCNTDAGQAILRSTENAPQFRCAYKYGYRKTKLVCGDISTTYDFHRHNKAGMLLKTNEGCFYQTKLVCAFSSITYQLSQKTKLN
jgi:hypothetical protein